MRRVAWTAALICSGMKAYSSLEPRVAHIDEGYEGILEKIAKVGLK